MQKSQVRELSPEEGLRMLDRQAQRYLGNSGEEFIRRWESGYYDKDPDQPELVDLSLLIPFAK
jgi:hypothetical protein